MTELRRHDQLTEEKQARQQSTNASKFRRDSDFRTGDMVFVRNQGRTSKFAPYFGPDPYVIIHIQDNGRKLLLRRCTDGQELLRHPDDVKMQGCHQIPLQKFKAIQGYFTQIILIFKALRTIFKVPNNL